MLEISEPEDLVTFLSDLLADMQSNPALCPRVDMHAVQAAIDGKGQLSKRKTRKVKHLVNSIRKTKETYQPAGTAFIPDPSAPPVYPGATAPPAYGTSGYPGGMVNAYPSATPPTYTASQPDWTTGGYSGGQGVPKTSSATPRTAGADSADRPPASTSSSARAAQVRRAMSTDRSPRLAVTTPLSRTERGSDNSRGARRGADSTVVRGLDVGEEAECPWKDKCCGLCDKPLEWPTETPPSWGSGTWCTWRIIALLNAAFQIGILTVFMRFVLLDGMGLPKPWKGFCSTMSEADEFTCFISVGLLARGIIAAGAGAIGMCACGGGGVGLCCAVGQGAAGSGLTLGQISFGGYAVGQLTCAWYRVRCAQVGCQAWYPLTRGGRGKLFTTQNDC